MKRVMFVTHKMTGGGCERVIAQLLKQFVADGIDCTLVTECSVPSFYPLPDAVGVIPLLSSPDMRAADVPRAYRTLRRLVREQRPDVVLAMPEKVNVWTVLFLLGTGVPVVVSERNDPSRHPESRLKRILRRLVYPFAAGFIFQTEQASAYFPKRVRSRGVVLPNPFDASHLPPPCIGDRARTVLGAGRLEPQKNFPLLIDAFADFYRAHPDWRLVIFGEGSLCGALQAQIDVLLPDGTASLPGQTDKLFDELCRCGMFVLSSDFEGMPNALIEAMAAGAPVVATDCPCGGCAALVLDGENGLLVPVGDRGALERAMARIADDEAASCRMGRRAADVRASLDARQISQKWRRYLDGIAAK